MYDKADGCVDRSYTVTVQGATRYEEIEWNSADWGTKKVMMGVNSVWLLDIMLCLSPRGLQAAQRTNRYSERR